MTNELNSIESVPLFTVVISKAKGPDVEVFLSYKFLNW